MMQPGPHVSDVGPSSTVLNPKLQQFSVGVWKLSVKHSTVFFDDAFGGNVLNVAGDKHAIESEFFRFQKC
jgi:hypothetical protein